MSKVGIWFKFLFNRIVGYMTTPANIKFFTVQWGSILLRVPASTLSDIWDRLWVLVQDAAKAFPQKGTGSSKYEYVLESFKTAFPDIAIHILDFVLHILLPTAEDAGRTV